MTGPPAEERPFIRVEFGDVQASCPPVPELPDGYYYLEQRASGGSGEAPALERENERLRALYENVVQNRERFGWTINHLLECEEALRTLEAESDEAPADEKQREFLERHDGRMGRVDVTLAEARGEAPAGLTRTELETALYAIECLNESARNQDDGGHWLMDGEPLAAKFRGWLAAPDVRPAPRDPRKPTRRIGASPAPSSTGGREGRE